MIRIQKLPISFQKLEELVFLRHRIKLNLIFLSELLNTN